MSERSDEELDRLLARGRMGGPGREHVLGRVLQATEAAAPKQVRGAFWAGLMAFASAGAVAAALVLVHRSEGDSFTSKGGATAAAPRVDVECLDGERTRCAMGQTLVFRAEDCAAGGYLAAYAEREGSHDRIWYFPSKNDATLPRVAATEAPQVIPRGARIGPEHAPGRYTVTTVLARGPLSEDQLADPSNADILGRWTSPMQVTP